MLHACFMPITPCFTWSSGCFYAFSVTNILTRCHSASSLFSAVFYSRKVTKKIFAELKREKAKVNILPEASRSQKGRRRWTTGGPQHPQARPGSHPRLGRVWPTWAPPGSALPPIYSSRRENPKYPSQFSRKDPQPTSSSSLAREGSEALPGTLPERGIVTIGLLPHHASLRSDVWVVHHRTTGPWQ